MAPKILAVVGPCPFAKAHGAQLRVKNVLDLLKPCGSVSLVLASLGEHEPEALKKTAEAYDLKGIFRLERWPLGPGGRVLRECTTHYLNTHGFRLKPADRRQILELANEHDLVWIHNVRVANALQKYRLDQPTVLDADDLMSRFHASAAEQARGVKKILERKRSWQWRRREKLFLKRFDAVAVCSEGDKTYLGGSDRVHVVPNGFARSQSAGQRPRNGVPTIGFVGSLAYSANRDGALWFLKEVWPDVRKRIPEVRFRLAGDGSERMARDFGPGVEGAGWVSDMETEMAKWWLTVVPVHVGGGTRVKVANAFSYGCPVVSTSWGAYGYEAANGRDLLLADEPAAFADACLKILQDEPFAIQLACNARELFNKNWTWDAIAPRVAAAVETAIRHRES